MDLDRIISKKHGDDSELINMRLEDQYAALQCEFGATIAEHL